MSATPEELMNRYQQLKNQSDTIKTEMDIIKIQLSQAFPEGGEVAGHKITIMRGRISWPKVAKAFPEKDFPQLYKQETSLDQKKAAALIAPAQLDEYRTQATVSIR